MTVVSYWNGSIPNITELHFKSFLKQNDLNFKYVLFYEKTKELEISDLLPKNLLWLIDDDRFILRSISLERLMNDNGVMPFSKWKENFSYKVARKIRKIFSSAIFTLIQKVYTSPQAQNKFNLKFNEFIGLNFSHTSKFTGLSQHLTYRSDVFRSLISSKFVDSSILYVDLDICFTKRFSEYDWSTAFTSPWGKERFANTAILFLPSFQPWVRQGITRKFQLSSSAWPWNLYSESNCKEFGLELRRIEDFDPPWSDHNPSSGDTSAFFESRENSSALVQWVETNSFCFHWHNQWNTTPDKDSPYMRFLRQFTVT